MLHRQFLQTLVQLFRAWNNFSARASVLSQCVAPSTPPALIRVFSFYSKLN